MRNLLFATALCMALLFTGSVSASLLGTTVTGTLEFPMTQFPSTNYFDPVNNLVPPGALNETGPTVVIGSPAVEFGFDTFFTAVHADFDATTLTLVIKSSLPEANFTFTDSAFAGLSLAKVSDTLPGGVTFSLVGDVLTINTPAASAVFGATAVFSLSDRGGSSSTPLPPAVWSGLITAAGMACFAVRRRLA